MKEYIVYQCRTCKKHFVLMSCEVTHSEKESKYIACPFHGKHKDIKVAGAYDDLLVLKNDMMKKDTYIKRNGKTVQKGWGGNV